MKKRTPSSRQKKSPSPKRAPATGAKPCAGLPATTGSFAIVGLGASAGGLEALEAFLRNVPARSGLAYVIVQHLAPARKSLVVELLQAVTPMPVVEIRDRTPVRPDHVYVIPPNKDLSLLEGVLHLLKPASRHEARLSIDFFFRALAQDQGARAIGVLLSGMGTDGTLGLKAIREHAGMVLVQDPDSAKCDGMPRAAIAAGVADIIAPAEQLPAKLFACWSSRPTPTAADIEDAARVPVGIGKIILLIRARTGHDFSLYRRSTMLRRVERRMGVHQIARLPAYIRFLQENPLEVDILFKELLIGVTSFFRDPAVWEKLGEAALPKLLETRTEAGRPLRAWVPGCSTGEEAFTLAMVFKIALEKAKGRAHRTLVIYATDLDADAIAKARQGFYPESIAADVPDHLLGRFFTREEHGYRVNKEIREMVIFAPQNLVMDPPFTKLDLLVCRNLLIYLTPELQKKLFPVFHYSLNPGGVLVLGTSESVGDFASLFAPIGAKERVFRRIDKAGRGVPIDFPARVVAVPQGTLLGAEVRPGPGENLQGLSEQVLLAHHAPPAVLVNAEGDILYVSGRTGKFLEPAAGKANWNIEAMAREELRFAMTGALRKAIRERRVVTVRGIELANDRGADGVDIEVRPIDAAAMPRGMAMIVFCPSSRPRPGETTKGKVGPEKASARTERRVTELARAVREAQAELQASREEMQSSQEELRSMNEELQAANEELQSTNEELSTSKEEMQSLNEELQTVNAELQSKLEELSAANNDMKNLLNSTDIATVFLDESLHVRRFTSQANQLFNLIPGDVGRPITDLATELRYPELAADAREVLRSLVFSEKPITTRGGRWYSVRIMPYRTTDNRIAGLVITFTDITTAKVLEAELREKCGQDSVPLLASGRSETGRAAKRSPSDGE